MTGDLRPSTQELAAELTIVWLSNPDQSRSYYTFLRIIP